MLLSTESERNNIVDSQLACTLAAVAGALNTMAFEIVGFFSANMTGNVSSFSDHLAKANISAGMFFLSILFMFIAGAAFSTMIINAGRRNKIRSIYAVNILIEGAALLTLGVIESWFRPEASGSFLILSLSFLMGLQNAVVTRISNARVRTTHVSGASTDIGIELAMLFDVLRRKESPKDAPIYLERLKLHFLTISCFCAGGVAGIWFYHLLSYKFLMLTGVGLMCLALRTILIKKRILSH
ncbi:YoaK family protein [Winslowiella toletana]|uniref:YoaK family protein n=1 Tax=Winslowiella toletana TaxID=92490 RepID=UPI0028BEB917|nr:YoaK family protein [Winslowiella toletana]WNN42660.1 YoaK family protein [Winslowiella toletana]